MRIDVLVEELFALRAEGGDVTRYIFNRRENQKKVGSGLRDSLKKAKKYVGIFSIFQCIAWFFWLFSSLQQLFENSIDTV